MALLRSKREAKTAGKMVVHVFLTHCTIADNYDAGDDVLLRASIVLDCTRDMRGCFDDYMRDEPIDAFTLEPTYDRELNATPIVHDSWPRYISQFNSPPHHRIQVENAREKELIWQSIVKKEAMARCGDSRSRPRFAGLAWQLPYECARTLRDTTGKHDLLS